VEEPDKKTIAQLLLEIADQGRYFHTSADKAYVDIQVATSAKPFPSGTNGLSNGSTTNSICNMARSAGSETMSQVLGLLESQAVFDGDHPGCPS
jgi:hypothetical protein